MDNIINPDDIQGTPILAIPQGIPPNIFQHSLSSTYSFFRNSRCT